MQPKDVHSKNPAIMRGSQKAPLKGSLLGKIRIHPAATDRHGDILSPDKRPCQKAEEQAMDNLWLEPPWWFIGMKKS